MEEWIFIGLDHEVQAGVNVGWAGQLAGNFITKSTITV
jgi:hypothetical protein